MSEPLLPPATAIKTALEQLTQQVETLLAQPPPLAALPALLTEVSQTVQEAVGLMDEQGQIVRQQLQAVLQRLTPPPRRPPRAWWVLALLCLTVGLLGGAGLLWWHGPPARYDALALGVDTVLTQQYPALPKTVQEQLTLVYQQYGLTTPGQRQKGDKK